MTVVVDANLLAALFLPLDYSPAATGLMYRWLSADRRILAPQLAQYEVASVARRAVTRDWLEPGADRDALARLLALGISFVPPSAVLHEAAFAWAERLGHSKVCDAHFVAVAAEAGAPLWTADRRLVNALRQQGIEWVRLVGVDG